MEKKEKISNDYFDFNKEIVKRQSKILRTSGIDIGLIDTIVRAKPLHGMKRIDNSKITKKKFID